VVITAIVTVAAIPFWMQHRSVLSKASFELQNPLFASWSRTDSKGRYAAIITRIIVKIRTAVVVLRNATQEGRSFPLRVQTQTQ
jgi:hypothetical protein